MWKPRRLLLVGLTTGLVGLVAPTAALAASTRYAAPAPKGSGDCSTADNACDLSTAISGASNGDTVLVTAGTYSWTSGGSFQVGVSLVGQAGSRPVIDMTGSASLGNWTGSGSSSPTDISNLDLEATASSVTPLSAFSGVDLSHLFVRHNATMGGIPALKVAGSLRDSLIQSAGPGTNVGVEVTGSGSSPTALTSDTVVARGSGSVGVDVRSTAIFLPPCFTSQGNATLEDVIAHGDGAGLGTSATNAGCPSAPTSVISVGYSNYDGVAANNGTPTSAGHNQTDPASTNLNTLFVSPSTDLHERAGAPTIDAGNAAGIEPTDLDNKPRVQGSAPDIGTYETARPPLPPVHCVVPRLKGKTLSKARKLLKTAHCSLGKVKKPKHHKHGKLVLKSQSPSPGSVLANGTSVSVKLGPKPHHKKH